MQREQLLFSILSINIYYNHSISNKLYLQHETHQKENKEHDIEHDVEEALREWRKAKKGQTVGKLSFVTLSLRKTCT